MNINKQQEVRLQHYRYFPNKNMSEAISLGRELKEFLCHVPCQFVSRPDTD